MKQYLLNDVPDDLWDALRSDAATRETPAKFTNEAGRIYPSARTERTGTSLNNVVGEVLAKRYKLAFTPTNRPTFAQDTTNRSLYLRLPDEMMAALEKETGRFKDGTKRTSIIVALADHYMLSVPAEHQRTPKRKKK